MRCRRSAVVLSTDSRDPSSAGLFGIFCSLILASQIHLILLNQTTVESLNFRSMRDREQELLSHTHGWYQCWCVVFIPGPPARCVCVTISPVFQCKAAHAAAVGQRMGAYRLRRQSLVAGKSPR